MAEAPAVVTEVRGAVGFLTLNRPEALHALTLEMVLALAGSLERWQGAAEVSAAVVRSSGGRAFCAGGDVRRVCEAAARGELELARAFFGREYRLNRTIRSYPKPYVALLDGIAMGGGLGLSVHGAHRIATERTVVAMPEAALGLFPDVGATYFLPRLRGRVGRYLGLTGARLGPADALFAGLATAYVPSARLPELEAELVARVSAVGPETVPAVLAAFAEGAGEPPLEALLPSIDRCFGHDSLEAIAAALEREGSPWAAGALAAFTAASPTSLRVILRQLRLGERLTFDDALALEYRLSLRFVRGRDFCEGVRALLVDRDGPPRWQPASWREVSEDDVVPLFAPLGEGELRFDA